MSQVCKVTFKQIVAVFFFCLFKVGINKNCLYQLIFVDFGHAFFFHDFCLSILSSAVFYLPFENVCLEAANGGVL